MRIVLAAAPALVLASAVLLAGCATKQPVVQAKPPELTRNDCTTVVLFDKVKIAEPDEAVRPEHRAFLGHWQKGAWQGKWCHDMLISAVYPDGSVDLFDMHAPYAPWGKPATAFKRKGRINEQGVLTFRHGTEVRRYRVVDGRLHAVRSGATAELRAVLINPDTELQVASAVTAPAEMPVARAAPAPTEPVKLAAASKAGQPKPELSLERMPTLPADGGFEGAGTAPATSQPPPERGTTG